MGNLTEDSAKRINPNRPKLGFWVFIILGAMLCIELVNGIRIWAGDDGSRVFPFGYISKGVWSLAAFIRPLDADSTDIAPGLTATYNALHKDPNLYSDFHMQGSNFLYPPSAVVELAPFAYFARPTDLSTATRLVDLSGRICVLATIVIALFFLWRLLPSRWERLWVILLLAAFYPLRWMLVCVQAQSFVTLFVALVVLMYATGRQVPAGVFLALAACIKPYLALLLLFAAFRRRWRLIFAAVITAGVIISASIFVVGITPWRIYLTKMLPIMSQGTGFYPNQSINGIVHRWLGNFSFVLGPKSFAVMLASRIAAVVFICLSICPRPFRQNKPPQDSYEVIKQNPGPLPQVFLLRAVDVSIAILAITMSSPIAWEHYYAWSIVLFSICLAIIVCSALPRGLLSLLACSYLLLGTYWVPVQAAISGPLSVINSAQFFGAVLLLAVAWYAQVSLSRVQLL